MDRKNGLMCESSAVGSSNSSRASVPEWRVRRLEAFLSTLYLSWSAASWMRSRVSSLTSGLPRRARDTVDWETPARWAMSKEVALPFFCTWRDLLLVRRTQGPGQAGMLAALGLRRLFAGGKKKA